MRWLSAARGFIHIWYGMQAKVRCSPVKYHSNTVILTISSYVPRWPSSSILCRLIVHVYTIEKFKCTRAHESESSHTFTSICILYTNSNNWDIFVKREVKDILHSRQAYKELFVLWPFEDNLTSYYLCMHFNLCISGSQI